MTWCHLPEKWACHFEGLGLSTFCKPHIHWPPLRACHFYRQLTAPWEMRCPVSQGAFLKDWAGLDAACMDRQFLQLPHQREEIIHTCRRMAESLCRPPATVTTLLIGYTLIQNKKLKKKETRANGRFTLPTFAEFQNHLSITANAHCTEAQDSQTPPSTHTYAHTRFNIWKTKWTSENKIVYLKTLTVHISSLPYNFTGILDDKVLQKISI